MSPQCTHLRGALLWAAAMVLSGCAHSGVAERAPPSVPILPARPLCGGCQLAALAALRVSPNAVRCGRASTWLPDADLVEACALARAAERQPFLALLDYPGIDSRVSDAYYADADGRVWRLHSDSDTSGANAPCRTEIWLAPCAHLRRNGQEPSWLECDPSYAAVLACAEHAPEVSPHDFTAEGARSLSCSPPLEQGPWCPGESDGHCRELPFWFECRRRDAPGSPLPLSPKSFLACEGDATGTMKCELVIQ